MNIVAANNFLYLRGGSERVMFDEMNWMREQGHDVNVFGRLQSDACEIPHNDLFPSVVNLESVSGVKKIKAAAHIIYNRGTGKRFASFCDRTRPDIAHFHNIYAGLTTAVIDVCRQRKLPSVITLHDYKLVCPSYLMLNHGEVCERCAGGRFYHCLLTCCHKGSFAASLVTTIEACFNHLLGKYRQADYLICPSRFLLNKLAANGMEPAKLHCIPNGVDPLRFFPVYEDNGYFLYLGRLSLEKGIKTLIEVTQDDVGMKLMVIGEGPDKESLQKLAGDAVSFAGYKSGRELERLVQGAAFIVVPSEWYENASMVVLEAMAYGKPVIGSRMGGIPEQVVDGETGLLFDAGNKEQLKNAIKTLAFDKAKRQEMGRAARARLEDYFSLNRHCEQLLYLYSRAIQGA